MLVFFFWLLWAARGDLVPQSGIEPHPLLYLQWQHRVLINHREASCSFVFH